MGSGCVNIKIIEQEYKERIKKKNKFKTLIFFCCLQDYTSKCIEKIIDITSQTKNNHKQVPQPHHHQHHHQSITCNPCCWNKKLFFLSLSSKSHGQYINSHTCVLTQCLSKTKNYSKF